MQDSQGHRETTVTRRRGDQAFITTTKEDGQRRDYREEVLNMDDRECVSPHGDGGRAEGLGPPPSGPAALAGELAQFTDSWPQQDELRAPTLSDASSALGTFFRRWFSSW